MPFSGVRVQLAAGAGVTRPVEVLGVRVDRDMVLLWKSIAFIPCEHDRRLWWRRAFVVDSVFRVIANPPDSSFDTYAGCHPNTLAKWVSYSLPDSKREFMPNARRQFYTAPNPPKTGPLPPLSPPTPRTVPRHRIARANILPLHE